MKRLKVVWLCHFSNSEVQSIIKPFRKVTEYASWIPLMLEMLEDYIRFDMHVIVPHEYIRGIHKFDRRGVHYYFYNPYMPIIARHWPFFFRWDSISNFVKNKWLTKRIIDKIKPDVIHLQGAENAYYSSTILQFINKYPSILSIQGFVSLSIKKDIQTRKRQFYERTIIKSMAAAFIRNKKMGEDVKSFNPAIKLFWSWYPYNKILPQKSIIPIKYDIVFWSRVTKDKGIGDLLHAVAKIKNNKKNISLCVIGRGEIQKYQQLANDLGIYENVYWAGFLPTHEDVFSLALQSKISVLPTYYDNMPGGIVEAMYLGIPVVTYDVDSNPEINEKDEVISLVEKGNIDELVREIIKLLEDDSLRELRSIKGKARYKEMFEVNSEKFKQSLLEGYNYSIENFNKEK